MALVTHSSVRSAMAICQTKEKHCARPRKVDAETTPFLTTIAVLEERARAGFWGIYHSEANLVAILHHHRTVPDQVDQVIPTKTDASSDASRQEIRQDGEVTMMTTTTMRWTRVAGPVVLIRPSLSEAIDPIMMEGADGMMTTADTTAIMIADGETTDIGPTMGLAGEIMMTLMIARAAGMEGAAIDMMTTDIAIMTETGIGTEDMMDDGVEDVVEMQDGRRTPVNYSWRTDFPFCERRERNSCRSNF